MNKGRYTKLVMVTGENNNKYYEMQENNGKIDITYGRVDSTAQKTSKPSSHWDSIIREKVKKGYKDVTHLVSVQVTDEPEQETEMIQIVNQKVHEFMTLMQSYTNNLVSKTYSVKFDNVTQAQIDEAQRLIGAITGLSENSNLHVNQINTYLLDLYMVIPRYISNVRTQLLPHIDLEKTIQQEQDNLDAMASQVAMFKPKEKEVVKTQQTLLDVLGVINMEAVTDVPELEYLVKQIKDTRHKISSIFRLQKPKEDSIFEKWLETQDNKSTRILIHGTRCTSVIPILEQGLKIRPAGNFQFSGKVYGDGNYYSEVVNKSVGYTGYDNDIVLLVYEVHTGNPFVYDGWYRGNSFTLNYKELKSRGFDSTYVKAGNGLLNSEIIAYNEEQCRIKYIIHLKR